MSTGGKTVIALQAWGIEVAGLVHSILFVCESHAVRVGISSANLALAGRHDGQRLVRLAELDAVLTLSIARSTCFACCLGGPARPAARRSSHLSHKET